MYSIITSLEVFSALSDRTPFLLKVMVKTKYLQRFSPQNYAWLLNYMYTKNIQHK